jgi:hypothetical protein
MSYESMMKKYGIALTIERTVPYSTFGVIEYIKRINIQDRFNLSQITILPESNLQAGEIIFDGTYYYLSADIRLVRVGTKTLAIKGILLTCNASVQISNYVSGTLTKVVDGVKCLITKSSIGTSNDVAQIESGAGQQEVNYVYMAASVGLDSSHYLTDGSRLLKVMDGISPYMAAGIVEARATLETGP